MPLREISSEVHGLNGEATDYLVGLARLAPFNLPMFFL
jgi:hypothetical protein